MISQLGDAVGKKVKYGLSLGQVLVKEDLE
jgi:hypothetical protein